MITVDAVDDDAALFLISPSHKAPSHWKLFQLLQKKTSWKKAGWDSFVCNILTKWFASERVSNHQKQFYWLIDIFNNFSNKNCSVVGSGYSFGTSNFGNVWWEGFSTIWEALLKKLKVYLLHVCLICTKKGIINLTSYSLRGVMLTWSRDLLKSQAAVFPFYQSWC